MNFSSLGPFLKWLQLKTPNFKNDFNVRFEMKKELKLLLFFSFVGYYIYILSQLKKKKNKKAVDCQI